MDRPTTTRELYTRLLRYVVPYWKVFLLAIVSIMVLAATEPAIPALMKPLLDGSFIKKDPDTIRLMPVLLILLFLVRGISNYISSVALSWVSGKVIKDLRTDMFSRLLTLPSRFYDDNPTGTPVHEMQLRDIRDVIAQHLTQKERVIITLYYYEGLSMKEIAKVLHLTESRICQIHGKVVQRLREHLGRTRAALFV